MLTEPVRVTVSGGKIPESSNYLCFLTLTLTLTLTLSVHEMDGLWRPMLQVKYDGMSNRCQLDDGSRLATENLQRRSMFIGDYTSFSSFFWF